MEEETMKRPKKLPRGVFVRNGEYWIRYTDQNGKLHREKVGPFLVPAKRAVEKRRSDIRECRFFPERLRQRIVLFEEIAEDYLDARRNRRDFNHDEDRVELLLEGRKPKKKGKPPRSAETLAADSPRDPKGPKGLKGLPISDLTSGRLEQYLAMLAESHNWKPATYNRYRAVLSGIFRYAIKNENAKANPVRETAHRKENNSRVRWLTDKEEKGLIDYIRANCREREAEILIALHSGMRRSEQYRTAQVPDGGLKWEHINLRSSMIRLPRSKAERPREIPINSVLRKALLSVPRTASPYVFDGTDPNKWFVEACREAKIKNFHWHDLRHTFASRLAMAGVPIRTIADLMGHSEIQTTARYAHLAPGYLAEAVERLATPVAVPEGGQTDTSTDTKELEPSMEVG
jgi:integrase